MSRHCAEYDAATRQWVRRELTPEENAVRGRDEQRHAERLAKQAEEAARPKPPTVEERLAVMEAEIAALKARNPAPAQPKGV